MGGNIACFIVGAGVLLVGMIAGVGLIIVYRERICRPSGHERGPRHAQRAEQRREEDGRGHGGSREAWKGEENEPRSRSLRRAY